jgi:hypothetical protein
MFIDIDMIDCGRGMGATGRDCDEAPGWSPHPEITGLVRLQLAAKSRSPTKPACQRGLGAGRLTAALSGGAVAAMLLVLVAQPAHADTSVDIGVRPLGPSSTYLANPEGQIGAEVLVPPRDREVEVNLRFDFSAAGGAVDISQFDWYAERCTRSDGPRYSCRLTVPPSTAEVDVHISFEVTAKEAVPWQAVAVPVEADLLNARDPDLSNNRHTLTLDVRSNLADVQTSVSGASHQLVTPTFGMLQVRVATPNPLRPRTLAATFDLSQVQAAVDPSETRECRKLSGSRVRCERVVGRAGESGPFLEAYFTLSLTARPGATPGPAGRVRVTGEQVDGVDPNPSNNVATFTVDIATGQGSSVRFDVGDLTGAVGQTVTVPITVTNQGPDSVQWAGAAYHGRIAGLDFVTMDGCATGHSQQPPPGYCGAREWLPPGVSHRLGMVFTITACPDPGDPPTITTSVVGGDIVAGRTAAVRVTGCPGGGGGQGGPAPPAGAAADPEHDPAQVAPAVAAEHDPVQVAPASSGAPHDAGRPAAVGDWQPVGQHGVTESGMGAVGLAALLAMLIAARVARWASHG